MSGVGVTAGGNVGFAHRLGDNWQGVLAAGLSGTYYPTINAASVSASQSAELRYLIKDGYLGIGAAASEGADPINMDLAYTSIGPRISMAKLLTARDQFTASALYEWRNYVTSPMSNGNALTINAVLTHALDSTANIALLGGYENVTQQLAFNSYQDVSVGLGAYKEFSHGITAQVQGTARFAGFDDVNPFTLSTRQDQNLVGSITLTKRDWNLYGFAPSLNYTYTRNFSNIELYDFESHNVDFRLTKNF
jgi:outer membrane protein